MSDEYDHIDEPPGLPEPRGILLGRNAVLTMTDARGKSVSIPLSGDTIAAPKPPPRLEPVEFTMHGTLTGRSGSLIAWVRWIQEQEAETEALSLTGGLYPWPTRWKALGDRYVRTMADPVWSWL